jgi:hypothetical protein
MALKPFDTVTRYDLFYCILRGLRKMMYNKILKVCHKDSHFSPFRSSCIHTSKPATV